MAVTERISRGEEYQEPESSSYIYHPSADKLGLVILEANGFRVCAINEGTATLEPIQDGVLRYPPVQINVPRDPLFIEKYTQLEPNL